MEMKVRSAGPPTGGRRGLVNTHRVWERCREQTVVAHDELLEQRRKSLAFVVSELCQGGSLSASDNQGFEGPGCPVRHDCDEVLVLDDDPIPFGLQIVGENRSPPEVLLLSRDDRRDMLGRPDLTVRMRIARTHLLAAVFEDLDMADARVCAELRVLLGPCLDDVLQRGEWELAEAEIMTWRITNNK